MSKTGGLATKVLQLMMVMRVCAGSGTHDADVAGHGSAQQKMMQLDPGDLNPACSTKYASGLAL